MFMKQLVPMACLTAVLGFSAPSAAQVTDALKHAGQATVDTTKKVVTGAPKGATGKCKDGTYTKSATKSGACSKHGGVAKWY